MRPKVAEIRSMVALLDVEHENVDDLAREVLVKAWDLFAERDRWVCVLDQPGIGVTVHGFRDTKNQMMREIGKGVVLAGPERPRVLVTRLISVDDGGLYV